MADTALTTMMRIDMDANAAMAEVRRMQYAMTTLAQTGVNRLATQMGAASEATNELTARTGIGAGSMRVFASQVMASSEAAQALGIRAGPLSTALNLLGQGLGGLNPLMLAGAAAATILATAFFKERETVDDVVAAIGKYREGLSLAAERHDELSASAQRLIDKYQDLLVKQNALIRSEILQAEADVASINARNLKLLQSQAFFISLGFWRTALIDLTQSTAGLDTELAALYGQLIENEKAQGLHGKSAKDAAADVLSLRSRVLELQEALAKSSGGASLAEAQAFYQARMQLIGDQAAEEIAAAEGNRDAIVLIEEAKFLKLQELLLQYTSNYPIQLEDIVVASEDAASKIHLTEEKYRDLNAKGNKKDAAEITKVQLTAAQLQLRSAASTAANMLLLQKASLRETIASIIAEQQARLAALAVVALIEGVFYSITNPAAAASKWAAAAMAQGAGAIALGAIGTAFAPRDGGAPTAEEQAGLAGLAGTEGHGSTSGRTLVQQGPLTLNYRASMTIVGNVMAISDVREMWLEWNADLLRAAGVQSDELRRA